MFSFGAVGGPGGGGPAAFATTTDWPTSFTIEHRPATGVFVVRFEGVQHHDATPSS